MEAILRGDHARQPKAVEDATEHQPSGLLLQLDAARQALNRLTMQSRKASWLTLMP
ncbi:hypothetical protein [Arthrobacter sp. W4I7]|uniref:hypothetical protein n=1 Tax=Arthrobacter sp. W4I7 TaxID=3042296 RepID=UPI0027D79CD0|nr:hypothetical protein [Arthrobacter sp. W4I7]